MGLSGDAGLEGGDTAPLLPRRLHKKILGIGNFQRYPASSTRFRTPAGPIPETTIGRWRTGLAVLATPVQSMRV